jgi:hypothetical protein
MSLRTAVCLVLLAGGSLAAQQRSASVSPHEGFQISGTLVDAVTGEPIVRGKVTVAPVTQRGDLTTIITGDDGRFLFTLARGKYSLSAQARGYLAQSFNQHDTFSTAIVVGPDLDSGNLIFRLPHEGSITGVVTDEAGEPVREAQVALYFTGLAGGVEGTRLRGRIMTDDQGAYHFTHLLPGRYLIAVTAHPWYAMHSLKLNQGPVVVDGGAIATINGGQGPGAEAENLQLDVAYPITYYNGVTEETQATPIVLGRGEKAVADVSLQPVPAVHVRINMDGDSSSRPAITLERRVLGGPPIQVQIDRRGDSKGEEISGIPPGHYIMRTYAAGKPGNPMAPTAREIDINESGILEEKDQVVNYIPVSAELQFESEAPRQAALQLLNKKTREAFSERAASEGDLVFKQGVVPGSYEISIINAPDVYLKSISAAGAKISGRTMDVAPGSAVKLTITAARGEGQVTGVATRDGRPFAGAMIVLVPADPAHNEMLFRRDQSDSDGTFTLPAVVPGAYTALAIESGWELEWTNPEVLKNYLGRGIAVRVQPKGKYEIKVVVQEN